MLNVDDYGRIRRAKRDGLSIRDICKLFGHSHHTVRKALDQPEPQPYRRTQPPAPKLGALHVVIDQILADDLDAPRKQRHTMMRVFERLRDEHGYGGGYDAVRRYIGKRCEGPPRESNLPLEHPPGERVECDFGKVWVTLAGESKQVSVLVCTWSYSNAPFAIALPCERLEAVLTGMVAAFEFFGCVPRQVWWDNPKTVVTRIGPGRERVFHERFRALASWYCFEPCACLAGRPKEKPRAENRVYDLQRQWATPVPKVADLAQLNTQLRNRCLAERERRITHCRQTIGERWATERAAAYPLPAHPFDPCVYQEASADRGQLVHFDTNTYSVPHTAAGGSVTVKANIDEVVILKRGVEVARHPRCYEHDQQLVDPFHYLPLLHQRPGSLDRGLAFREWVLPPVYERLRQALELRHGDLAGKRHYIRIVQLLLDYPHELVHQAVAQQLAREGIPDAGAIRLALDRHTQRTPVPAALDLPTVEVPRPDLRRFDQLLTAGGTNHA